MQKKTVIAGLATAAMALTGCVQKKEPGDAPPKVSQSTRAATEIVKPQVIGSTILDYRPGTNDESQTRMYVIQATPEKYCIVTLAGHGDGGVAQNCYDGQPARPAAAAASAASASLAHK